MTRLQALMQRWIDADPARNPRDLARAGGLSPSVIYALLAKPLTNRPKDTTFRGLATAGVASETALRLAVAMDLDLVSPDASPNDPETMTEVRQLLDEI